MDYLISEPEMDSIKKHIADKTAEITALKEQLSTEMEEHIKTTTALRKIEKQLNMERETTKLVLSKLHELNIKLSKCYSEPTRVTFDQLV